MTRHGEDDKYIAALIGLVYCKEMYKLNGKKTWPHNDNKHKIVNEDFIFTQLCITFLWYIKNKNIAVKIYRICVNIIGDIFNIINLPIIKLPPQNNVESVRRV
jgi:hypothetical protein